MNKTETRQEIHKLLLILTKGSKQEGKDAKKAIEKLWHTNSKLFTSCAPIAFEYIEKFDEIDRVENQAAFASGLELFYLTLSDEYFILLKKFTLKVLQHPHGHVREAIRKTADWLVISLTSRVNPFVYPKGKKLNKKQKIKQQETIQQCLEIIREVEELIEKYPINENIQYIDEMKPSISKSLQMFWSRLIESSGYRKIQELYVPSEILAERNEIENRLSHELELMQSDLDIEDIKNVIYFEDGQDDFTNLLNMFENIDNESDLRLIVEILNDAWNYFPHRILDGLSPAEKLLEKNKFLKKRDSLPN